MNKIEQTHRPCEICGKNDLPCFVVASSIGAFSQNICTLCATLNAEHPSEWTETTYNDNDDSYYDKSDNHIPIKLQNKKTFNTRSEYVEYRKSRKE